MGHQVSRKPELSLRKWLLSDPLSYKVVLAQQHSVNWKLYISDQTQACPKDKSKSCEEVTQMPMVPTFVTRLSVRLHLWPYREFPLPSWQRRKFSGLVCRWFCMICGYHTKWTSSALQPYCGTFLKDHGEGKSPSEQIFEQYTWSDVGYMPIRGLWPMVWLGGWGLGTLLKIDDKEVWERCV